MNLFILFYTLTSLKKKVKYYFLNEIFQKKKYYHNTKTFLDNF